MPRLRNISLQNPVFNPAVFTPAVFEPKQEDLHLLANSLNVLENRRVAANEQMAAMDTAFAKVRESLHNDPETMKWFQNYTDDYKKQVDAYAQQGDYANAMTAAKRLAAEAINNPELHARTSTNEQYEKKKSEVMSMPISDIRKQRWLEQNPYSFEDYVSRDENGNVVSADWKLGQTGWMPVANVSLSQLAHTAAQMVAQKSGSFDKGVFTDVFGTPLSETDKGAILSKEITNSFQAKPEKEIRENFIQLLYNTPGAIESVRQDIADTQWQIDKYTKELSKLTVGSEAYSNKVKDINNLKHTLTADNGAPLSIEDYALKSTNNLIKNQSYYNAVTNQQWNKSLQTAGRYGSEEELEAAINQEFPSTYGYSTQENKGELYNSVTTTTNNYANGIPYVFKSGYVYKRVNK